MIFGLKGIVKALSLTTMVIDVNDVYYEVFITNRDAYEVGSSTFVYIYQVIREERHELIGFQSLDEKAFFTLLITVSGIGPKTALAILSATNASRLEQAIKENDLTFLKTLPGLGPKSASQIILDLKGKLTKTCPLFVNTNRNEVEQALINLGFKKAEFKSILDQFGPSDLSSESLLKLALNALRK